VHVSCVDERVCVCTLQCVHVSRVDECVCTLRCVHVSRVDECVYIAVCLCVLCR
jgi:hypothetical protein